MRQVVESSRFESLPAVLHVIAAPHPQSVRPCPIELQAAGLPCFFAFTSREHAEFFIDGLGYRLVPLAMGPRDFSRLHQCAGDRVKYVAINPRLHDCAHQAEVVKVVDLGAPC